MSACDSTAQGAPAKPVLEAPLTSLAAGAAHDLRNVLFVISAHSERLISGAPPGDPRLEDLRAIRDAATRGATLAREIVVTARDQARPKLVDVNAVIRGIEPLVRRLAGERVIVTVAPGRSAWPVAANAVQLEQVVMNLVVNARDAMPDGGRVVISTENRTISGAGVGAAARFVVLSVADTGAGIDPAIEDRVFEPFFTTREQSGGTGVGLATVRAIALLNGGQVELSTCPGAGTTVRVVLPRGEAPPQEAAGVRGRSPKPGVGTRILLVENERAIRDFLARSLTAEGYEVRAASSGAEALTLADPGATPADLILTDVNLPDMNGSDVARRIRARWPASAVVFISGAGEALHRLSEAGLPVLAKPFTASQLVSAVQAVLAGRAA
jgi:two-component system cell cycle sensor histidine kinase/response regulator CckA